MRDGVTASQVALPAGPWRSMLEFLVERFPAVTEDDWRERLITGEVVDAEGRTVSAQQPYTPQGRLYYYRALPGEPRCDAQASVLFEDELLVVADKPHFLPVTPSGQYLHGTLLVQLRRQLGVAGLSPLHRIDRETAGVVLFAKRPEDRAAYQALFAQGTITKHYQAIAQGAPHLRFPLVRRSMLRTSDHFMQMREVETPEGAAPNAHTEVDVLETQGAWARYGLRPFTGKRHQLRVHMAALGLPILGDRIYPALMPYNTDEPHNPLRLLAARIAFRDPVTGEARAFASERRLHFPADGEVSSLA